MGLKLIIIRGYSNVFFFINMSFVSLMKWKYDYLSNTSGLSFQYLHFVFLSTYKKLLAIYAEVGLESKGCPIISGDKLKFYM